MWILIWGPLGGAFIGWVTNRIAVQMIFRPYRPWKIPFTSYEIQGLIPKRQDQIARTVGQVVQSELFSMPDFLQKLIHPETQEKIISLIGTAVSEYLQQRLPVYFPSSIKNLFGQAVDGLLHREAPAMMQLVIAGMAEGDDIQLNLAKVIEEKIKQLDLPGLERLVLSVAARELKHIEILGAVLGFIIGLLQAGLTVLTRP